MTPTARLTACFLMLSALSPLPALAQDTPLSAEEFESYVTGRTLTFGVDGVAYGIEQYLPDRRVLWSFIGDECREGVWYEKNSQICFVYEHDPSPQCWTFFQTDDGLRARFESEMPAADLYEVEQSRQPLLCAGPQVGV
ncbi:hypothetical protein [Roseicitreum antarcticum]|uniref:Uncharacterized protein n=1 Tax=Roseicitreum antarcticum TaxID=564137 RepID=A0A1H3A0B7_9RHOB|nr:hypothetical protein [Roseicitreum antarcticum]SDX23222.1 hypothetical protein SAMN04488238_106159 [Roseicitreum antarcticum]